MPIVDHGRAVSFRQPVKMRDVEARLLHGGEHGFRRRRRGGEEFHHVRQRLFLIRRRVEQRRHHDRRAAQMRHLVIGDGVVHRGRAHRAQANMRAGDDADRPGKAPAVAMEHRQRPEINRMLGHAAGDDIADREQRRAAVMIDHALRIAGGARSVIERDRVPFVVRHLPGISRVAFLQKLLVIEIAEFFAGAGIFRIVVIDHQRLDLGARQRLAHHAREFAVDDQHFAFGVIEREGVDRRIEPGVDGVEHGAAHRHAIMRLKHGRRVGEHDRDRVAALDAALGQSRREPARAVVEVAIAAPQ